VLFVAGNCCHDIVLIVTSQDVTQIERQLDGACHAEHHACALDLAVHSHLAS